MNLEPLLSMSLNLDGTLGDANTLQVHRLRIFSQKNKTEYNFEPEDDRYLTFKK